MKFPDIDAYNQTPKLKEFYDQNWDGDIGRWEEKFEQAKSFLEKKYDKEFSSYYLSSLLGHYFDSDDVHIFLIFHKEIDTIDLKTILDNEINTIIGTFKFDSSEFDFVFSDRIEKARIKENGLVWIIHNSDKDPKPSKPHAHEYSLNVKP